MQVARFTEKPDGATALDLIAGGALWNSGLFAWTAPCLIREVEAKGGTIGKSWHDHDQDLVKGQRDSGYKAKKGWKSGDYQRSTVGWSAGCDCDSKDTVPCLVLDPFMGSGTTAFVATKLARDYVGYELNKEYMALIEKRLKPFQNQERLL